MQNFNIKMLYLNAKSLKTKKFPCIIQCNKKYIKFNTYSYKRKNFNH